MRAWAEAIGTRLGLPAISLSRREAEKRAGWMAPLAAADLPAPGAWTRDRLDWRPTRPDLLTDLHNLQLVS